MKKSCLSIQGMTCSACSSGLENFLNKQKGIISASVNLVLACLNVEYDDNQISIKDIGNYIKQAGFKSLGNFRFEKNDELRKKQKRLLIIFSFLTVFAFLFSFFDSCIILNFILSICFLFYGKDILISGAKNIWHKMPNMDSLVLLGSLASFLYSLYLFFYDLKIGTSHSYYFETVVIIIYFVKLGRFIDNESKEGTKEAIKKLVTITPDFAIIKKDDIEKKVTLDTIKQGDILISKAGEKIAVDGKITKGHASFDESFITGESKVLEKSIGDQVIAGSINCDGAIEYEAQKIGKDTLVSQIVKLVYESSSFKPNITKLTDKLCFYFVPTIIILSLLTFLFHFFYNDGFNNSFIFAICVLVCACPCALGLAAPLAFVVGEGEALKKGVIIKNGKSLENASKIDAIIFDKTGTLTYGKPKIVKIYNYSEFNDNDLIQLAATLEKSSTHPISNSFLDYIKENNLEIFECIDFKNIVGLGVSGKVNNESYFLGSDKLLEKYNITPKKEDEENLKKQNCTIVYLVKENKILALFGIKDKERKEAKDIIAKLKNLNITPIMLSGDKNEVVSSTAEKLGIEEYKGGVLPSEKQENLVSLKEKYKVIAMCGDGINDSPVLVKSDIGITLNTSTDIAKITSSVIINNDNLENILNLIFISKKIRQVIKQNLFWAFFYNILIIPIASGFFSSFNIMLNPSVASFFMVFSSIMIVLNTLRLKLLFKE